MALLPNNNIIEKEIEGRISTTHARYLSVNSLGKACSRQPWYRWRWVKENFITPVIQRKFDKIEYEKQAVIYSLLEAGATVSREGEDVDSLQHCYGKIDGVINSLPGAEKTLHLLKVMVLTETKFNALNKKIMEVGAELALLATYPEITFSYQYTMGKLELTRCLLVIVNKNTEARLYHRINFNTDEFRACVNIELSVTNTAHPPRRISERADWWQCKACEFSSVCHSNELPQINCRTCNSCNPEDGGNWYCSVHNANVPLEAQRSGCDQYTIKRELH